MHRQKCFDKRAPVFLQCRVCYLIRAVAGRFDTVKSICPASLRWMRALVGMKDVCSRALLCCLLCIVRVMTVLKCKTLLIFWNIVLFRGVYPKQGTV